MTAKAAVAVKVGAAAGQAAPPYRSQRVAPEAKEVTTIAATAAMVMQWILRHPLRRYKRTPLAEGKRELDRQSPSRPRARTTLRRVAASALLTRSRMSIPGAAACAAAQAPRTR